MSDELKVMSEEEPALGALSPTHHSLLITHH
jgi:hypothetical protein